MEQENTVSVWKKTKPNQQNKTKKEEREIFGVVFF